MKKILVICLLSLPNLSLGMDETYKETTLYCNAMLLEKTPTQIQELEKIDSSEIKNIIKNKAGNFICYMGALEGGDSIIATFFKKGPAKGKFECNRSVYQNDGPVPIPLNKEWYHKLKKLYKTSNKK